MINLAQVRDLVIRPTLLALDKVDKGQYSLAAEQLLLGTLVAESDGKHLAQIGGGPALGLWQIEPDTARDVWQNWLNHRSGLWSCVNGFFADHNGTQLATNLNYGCAIARQIYRRSPDPLPEPGDDHGMGHMWKKVYNTNLGAGEASDFAQKFVALVQPLYK